MKKNIGFTIIIALIVFTFSIIQLAQEGSGIGRLVGYVTDTDKKPVEGAKIALEYIKYNKKLNTTSDKNGKFVFMGLGLGDVKISVKKDDFIFFVIQTRVSGAGKNPIQHIVLRRTSEVKPKEDSNKTLKTDFTKASALFTERKFEQALPLFQSFLKKKPDMFKIRINIGNCYLELQRYQEAINEFQTVLEKIKEDNSELKGDKTAAQIYATIGDIYMRQNQLKKAEEYFKKSIEIDKSDQTLAYNIAEILFAAGKTDEAIEYYRLAIKIKPEWSKSYKQCGYAFLNKGDIPKAIEMFNKFLELDPDSPEAPGITEVIKSLK